MVIQSFAKLNLYLKVVDKRADNYHNLITLFERINLVDTITLKKLSNSSIIVKSSDKTIPLGEDNLSFKAARILRDKFAFKKGVEINIIKRIPVGAGLGGGSSNAAAVLLGLNRLWRLNLSNLKLVKIALKIGSDVPFFIYDKPFALGLGRGEIIKPLTKLNRVRLWHILVVPKINVSTPFIYASYESFNSRLKPLTELTKGPCGVKILTSELAKKKPYLTRGMFFNSLQEVAIKTHPKIGKVVNTLLGLGLENTVMSGSGGAVFSITPSHKKALQLVSLLKKRHKAWRVYAVSTA
ncbi:MAG: 4-(cytidine 5'-diphospho)-2-C-methyl-D-erythritol kinase [Candidatus Omnitrophota bacterium]